jgi:hemerythrin superfamily protein
MPKSSSFVDAIKSGVDDLARALTPASVAGLPGIGGGVNILDLLKADHDRFRDLLDKIMKGRGQHRADLFKTFKLEITAHSRAEEKALYVPMQKFEEGKKKALEGDVEHEVVDYLLAELARPRNKDTDNWTARCQVLQELTEHHLDEEESDLFPMARKHFDSAALDKMGQQFIKEKRKHGVNDEVPRQAAE